MSTSKHETTAAEEKVPDTIARAFEDAPVKTDEPEVLTLDEANSEPVRREMDNKPVARVYDCPTYDCRAYYAVRDEQVHFYYKAKGFPIDDCILFSLEEMGVEKVFIGMKHEKTVLEFNLNQYMEYEDGERFNHGFGDQRVTPKDNALREWPNAVGAILADE